MKFWWSCATLVTSIQVKLREMTIVDLQKNIVEGDMKLKQQQVPAKQFAEMNKTIRRDAHALT